VVVALLGIGGLAGLSGCSGSQPSSTAPPVGASATAVAGPGVGRLESLGVQIMPILPGPASAGYTQVFAEGSRLRDEDLKALGAVEHLEVLKLDATGVTDAGLEHLSGLTGLRWLYLERTRITDAGLRALKPLRALTILDVAGTAAGDAGLERIARLESLAGLDLTGTRVTDAGLRSLAPLGQLEVLRLSRTAVTDAGLEALSALHALKSLSLDGCPGVRGRGLRPLASLPDLQVLVLDGAPVDDEGMDAIGTLAHLSELYLEGTSVSDAGLARLRGLASLRKVFLHGTRCTEEGVKALAAALPKVVATLRKPTPAAIPARPPRPARAPAPFERVADVIYGWKHGMALTMDVFKPGRPANGAAVAWVIGDSYYSRRESITPTIPLMDELLTRGYHVFAVTHGATPLFNVEEAIGDVHRAVRFIRHKAGSYGIDPGRIGAVGRSGAGHLALMLGMGDGHGWHFEDPIARGELAIPDPIDDESGRAAAVVCLCGPTDWRNYGEPGHSVLDHAILAKNRYLGPFVPRELDEATKIYRAVTDPTSVSHWLGRVSPISYVSKTSAPVLLVYGEKDENVPLQQARAMLAALHKAGVACELEVKPGATHGWNDAPADLIRAADWFDRHLPSGR
jgi:acetyl esterase/lipase